MVHYVEFSEEVFDLTPKERMLTALSRGKPDRLPVTIHQWQSYHLVNFMGGRSEIEAFESLGMDASATFYPSCRMIETRDWRETAVSHERDGVVITNYQVTTPKGNLTYQISSNAFTSWYSGHLIKQPEDIFLFRDYFPRMELKREELTAHYDRLGDGGIARCDVPNFQGGCYQAAQVLYGTEQLIYACYDEPDWVHEFLEIILQRKLEYINEQLRYAKVDLVETGGGGSSDTVISPALHEEFCLPYDKRLHKAVHDVGFPVVYHTCGGMKNILGLIAQNGCDASETLSPPEIGGNIRRADRSHLKQSLNGIALIGGMDQINLLTSGTAAEIRTEVFRLFEDFGKDGGYILSACDHFFEAPVENLRVYTEAARECVYS